MFFGYLVVYSSVSVVLFSGVLMLCSWWKKCCVSSGMLLCCVCSGGRVMCSVVSW